MRRNSPGTATGSARERSIAAASLQPTAAVGADRSDRRKQRKNYVTTRKGAAALAALRPKLAELADEVLPDGADSPAGRRSGTPLALSRPARQHPEVLLAFLRLA